MQGIADEWNKTICSIGADERGHNAPGAAGY